MNFDVQCLPLLRCNVCKRGAIQLEGNGLCCTVCARRFELVSGRFPDFLLPQMRAELEKELEFENQVFGHADYDYETEEYYQRVAAWLGFRDTDVLLEVGCGSGAWLRRMPGQIKVGLEPCVQLLEHGTGFCGVVGEALHLPFQAASFDHVFFKYSLHHIQNREEAIGEAARVLKPGGTLSLLEPNASHPQRRLISNPNSWFRKSGLLIKRIGPVESFQTAEQVVCWARKYGLEVEKIDYTRSEYREKSVRQDLQRMFETIFGKILSPEFVYPNYAVQLKKHV